MRAWRTMISRNLFVPQCDHWIYARRPARRNQTRERRGYAHHEDYATDRYWIGQRHGEYFAADSGSQCETTAQTHRKSDRDQHSEEREQSHVELGLNCLESQQIFHSVWFAKRLLLVDRKHLLTNRIQQ